MRVGKARGPRTCVVKTDAVCDRALFLRNAAVFCSLVAENGKGRLCNSKEWNESARLSRTKVSPT